MSRKVSEILTDIVELGDNELELLLQMLDSGMWDEWDTGLVGGLSMFGAAEVRIAARAGQITAKHIEEQSK